MRSTISLERHNDLRRPQPALFERHELDKTHHNVFFAGEAREALDLIVVEAAQKHAIDLEWRKPRRACCANTLENHRKAARDTRDLLEGRSIHGVHAHCDPVEPRRFERDGERFQQMAVSGQSKVERIACRRTQARQFLNQLNNPAPQERLAASQSHLGDPQADKKPNQPQIFFAGQFRILCSDFARAAIHAFVVAAVGDGDAQIVDHAPMAVGQRRVRGHRGSQRIGKQRPSAILSLYLLGASLKDERGWPRARPGRSRR